MLCPNLTRTDKFWNEVIYYFRFYWPYNMQDIVMLNPVTKLYEFSGVYDHHLYDIRMWRMDMRFFESFPETYDDIMPSVDIERPMQSVNAMCTNASPKSWNATPWPLLIPVPEDQDEKAGGTGELDQFFAPSDIGNWDTT